MLHKLFNQKFNLGKMCESVGDGSKTVGVARSGRAWKIRNIAVAIFVYLPH